MSTVYGIMREVTVVRCPWVVAESLGLRVSKTLARNSAYREQNTDSSGMLGAI